MGSRDGFTVQGVTAVVRDLQALGLGVDDLKDAFSSLASEGAEIAASHAPNLTGRLRGSVRGNRAKSKAVVIAGRSAVPYAAAINYGWPRRGIAASGFMQKASEEMEPKAIDRLEAEINHTIRRKGLT